MDINDVLKIVSSHQNCSILAQSGFPKLSNHKLPLDLKNFYALCGGMLLFEDEPCSWEVLAPDNFTLANPIIVGKLCEYDISSEWYTICRDNNGNYITIDLNPERLGRCYDSFLEVHGLVGDCAVVANSFTELLSQLIKSKGKNLYWLESDFKRLGDAYDNIDI